VSLLRLFVLEATLSFWTIETLELFNTVTLWRPGTGQFPLSIYRALVSQILPTFVCAAGSRDVLSSPADPGRAGTALAARLVWLGLRR